MFIPEVAAQFQQRGVTALIYDPRNLGESDGQPRNDIDPIMQVSDYSDAVSFLMTVDAVDPSAISIWGQSFAGVIALCAAALDRRVRSVIAVCPLLGLGLYPRPDMLDKVLYRCMQDRHSRLAGNEPTYLPVLTPEGKNPAGSKFLPRCIAWRSYVGQGLLHDTNASSSLKSVGLSADKEEFDYMVNAKSRGAPNYENRTTLQSYYKIQLWQPHGIMARMAAETPVFMLVPENDMISKPQDQLELFETFGGPKEVHIVPGKGHLNVLGGDNLDDLMHLQTNFLRR